MRDSASTPKKILPSLQTRGDLGLNGMDLAPQSSPRVIQPSSMRRRRCLFLLACELLVSFPKFLFLACAGFRMQIYFLRHVTLLLPCFLVETLCRASGVPDARYPAPLSASYSAKSLRKHKIRANPCFFMVECDGHKHIFCGFHPLIFCRQGLLRDSAPPEIASCVVVHAWRRNLLKKQHMRTQNLRKCTCTRVSKSCSSHRRMFWSQRQHIVHDQFDAHKA